MGHDMRQIEKEGTGRVPFDERHGAFGESPGEFTLVRVGLDHLIPIMEWQRRHFGSQNRMILGIVIGVRQAQPLVETVPQRIERRHRAEVPLSDTRRSIAPILEHFRQQPFLRMDSVRTWCD